MEESVMIIPFEEDEHEILEEKSHAWDIDKGEVLRRALEKLLAEINYTMEIMQEGGFHAEFREAIHQKMIIEQKIYDFCDYEVRVENRKPRRRATSMYSVAIDLLTMPWLWE